MKSIFFSIARIPNIKMQTGNQIVFPLPEYQYTNADMKSIHFSIARIPNIKMQIGNQIVFPLPEYQYTTQIINCPRIKTQGQMIHQDIKMG
jgi:hypothetical protein